jgi:FAD/FMN-containing dehydrogenase
MVSYEIKKSILLQDFQKKKGTGIIALDKKTSNLFRSRQNIKKTRLDVKNFNQVIYIDSNNLTAEVEGMTTFETLVNETLKYGLLPPVVPQLKMITLGGAISGIGIEASSFKYGLVHETVLEMEVLLGDGRIITCTPNNEHKSLFFSLPNSYGTLGYILKVKIKLIKAKRFVEINHKKYDNPRDYFKDINSLCDNKKYDFIDGVVFNEKEMYISLGKFKDQVPYKSNYKYMKIYYKSLKKNKTDYLTTSDFIWRWDSDWFWTSNVFYMQNFIPRLLFGKFMLNSKAYLAVKRFNEKYRLTNKIHELYSFFNKKDKIKKEPVIQDVGIPIENCEKFLEFFNKEIKIKPIWICPTKIYNNKQTFPLFDIIPNKLYIDFGFWDSIKSDKPEGYYNKKIEQIVEKLNGEKSLYSDSFYEKNNFWKIYNGKIYFKIKNKYDPNSVFLDLYNKCVLKI